MLRTANRPILKPLILPEKSSGGLIHVAKHEYSGPAIHRGAVDADDREKKQLKNDAFVAKCVEICEGDDEIAKRIDAELSAGRLRQAGADEQSKLPLPPANEPIFIRRVVIPPEPLKLEEAVDKVVWVKRCLDIIANSIASIPIRVMRRPGGRFGTDAGEPDYESDAARLLLRLLERPNAHQSGTDLLEAMSIWLNVRQCILWMMWEPERAKVSPEEAAKKPPRALYCLPAHRAVGMMSEGSLYYWRLNGAAGEYAAIPAWQTIRIGDYNPKEELRGNPPLLSAFQTADTEYATEIYHANLFDRGLMVSGFVTIDSDNMSDEEFKRYQAMFDQMSGVGNAFSVAVIGKKANYKSMTMNQKDMDYKGLSEANKKKIAGALGVPMFMLGEPDAGGKISAIEARKSFWQDRVIPQQKKLINKLNVHLVPYFSDPDIYLEGDTSNIEALAEDRTDFAQAFYQTSQAISSLTSSGVMSPEDAAKVLQERFGMEVEGQPADDPYPEEEEIETEGAENEDEILDEELDEKIMALNGRIPALRQAKNHVINWLNGGAPNGKPFPRGQIFSALTSNGVNPAAAGVITERISVAVESLERNTDRVARYFSRLEQGVNKAAKK